MTDRRVSSKQYQAILAHQGGACGMCNREVPERLRPDRDRWTGELRSLLCNKCYAILKGFKFDLDILARALKYLRENP